MTVPLLPLALVGIGLTFALAILGWWIAQKVERRHRTAKRIAETNKSWEQQGGARRPQRGRSPGTPPRS